MRNSMFDLHGRTALITGSSRGLGRAMAEGLARAGAAVILNGTDSARVQEAVAAFEEQGFQARGAAFDINDEAAIRSAFATFDDDRIAVDILVNNAGIQLRRPMI